MPVLYITGDVFASRCHTIGHGVNCRGRMGAGIAPQFKRRFPEMYREYRRRCHSGELEPGGFFLWKASTPWVVNLATQATTGGASLLFVRDSLGRFADSVDDEGVHSLALPRIAAGLGGLGWDDVREVIDVALGPLAIPVFVYEHYVEGLARDEIGIKSTSDGQAHEAPVLFWGSSHPEWRALSNFEKTPFVVAGKQYATVEHFFQASKATTDWEHELVRTAVTAKTAKQVAHTIRLRPDWEEVKEEVMQAGLIEKFRQNERARSVLLSTGDRPLHEDSPYDAVWGWMGGAGEDRLGKLLAEVRTIICDET